MTQVEIIISGFGGQGALFAGQVLAYAAMDEGRHVTWIPSYGPEMRGGTAHCTVIISDDSIGSPLVRNPGSVIAMNAPSFDKYEPLLKAEGLLVYNSSLIDRQAARSDIQYIAVPANQVAEELGNVRLANMVMTGALITATEVLPALSVEQALADHLPERHRKLIDVNREALYRGASFGESITI